MFQNSIRSALASASLLFTAAATHGETITVCSSGCDHTSINAAIDAAESFDVMKRFTSKS